MSKNLKKFLRMQKENNINNIEKSLLEIKKEKWYKKLINKILKFFKIKEG